MRSRSFIPHLFVLTTFGAFANTAGAIQAPSGSATQTARTTTSTGVLSGTTNTNTDGEDCSCTATYMDGSVDTVDACTHSECPDVEQYLACHNREPGDPMPISGCKLLETCDCHCWETESRIGQDFDEDVMLAGVTNLWQFDYGCGAFGTNAVGCGPVAAAMLLEWWAQQGYDGLIDGFLNGGGTSPSTQEHDWMALVETLRDDYLDGGICINGMYATTQTKLRDGIDDFISDSGYSADVEHVKVCLDCKRNESDEIDSNSGLEFILDELYSGRPVIMGFNVGRATERTRKLVDDDGTTYTVYSGDLSNGDAGWIDHYVVVTGYRKIDEKDVIFVNLGWDPDTKGNPWVDIPFVWKPAGKWLHLYSVDMNDSADGDDYCVHDRTVPGMFMDDSKLDASFESVDDDGDGVADEPLTVLAGESCGIMRQVREYEYNVSWDTFFECDPMQQLEEDIEQNLDDIRFGGTSTDLDRGSPDVSTGTPTVEWIPPP